MIKFNHLECDGRHTIKITYGDDVIGQLTLTPEQFKEWSGVVDGGFALHEMLALRSARRILGEIAQHQKLGDDGYHDSVVDLATRWMELYCG